LGRGLVVTQPQLSADGRTLVYGDGQNRLVRLDLATARETELVKGWFGSIALSPDGTQLAWLGNTSSASFPANQIAVMPSEGGPWRVLFESPTWSDGSRFNSIGWSHDQRYVLFAKDDTNNGGNFLWRVPVAGGPPQRIGVTANAAQVRFAGRIKSPTMHPDGRKLAFSVVNDVPPELWVLENFLPRK
jgi:Tol biopolymer transport system component